VGVSAATVATVFRYAVREGASSIAASTSRWPTPVPCRSSANGHVLQLDRAGLVARDELQVPDRIPVEAGDQHVARLDVGVLLLHGVLGELSQWTEPVGPGAQGDHRRVGQGCLTRVARV
jgi:hypothetical protein